MSLSTAIRIVVAGSKGSPELLKTEASIIAVETDVLRLIHQS